MKYTWARPGLMKGYAVHAAGAGLNQGGLNLKNLQQKRGAIMKCSCKKSDQCKCNKCERGIYPLHCDDCGKFLAEVPKSTLTYCPDCRRWSRIEPGAD